MSTERKAIQGIKWTAASKALAQVFGWAATLIVMRLLVPADYGLMAMVAVVLSIAATVAELGLGASLVQARSLSEKEQAQVAGVILVLNVAIGVVVGVLAPLISWAFGEERLTPMVRVMALQFLFTAISSVPQALLLRDMDFKRIASIDLVGALTSSVTTLVLAILGSGVWSLIGGNLAGAAVRTLLLVALTPRIRVSFRLRGAVSHLRYGGLLTATRIAWDVILQTDIMIASRFLSPSAIGAYSVGLHLATLPMQKMMMVVNQVAFAAVARLQDEPARIGAGLLKAFRLATLLSVPLLWGLAACAPEFVRVVLGAKWEEAILPVQVLSLVIPVRLVSGLMWTAVVAVGRTDVFMRLMSVAAILFPMSFFIGVHWGLTGLTMAWLFAWVTNFCIGVRWAVRPIGLSLSGLMRSMAVPLLAGIPMIGAIVLTRVAAASLSDALRLPLLAVAGALVYLITVTALDRSIWRDVRSAVHAMRG